MPRSYCKTLVNGELRSIVYVGMEVWWKKSYPLCEVCWHLPKRLLQVLCLFSNIKSSQKSKAPLHLTVFIARKKKRRRKSLCAEDTNLSLPDYDQNIEVLISSQHLHPLFKAPSEQIKICLFKVLTSFVTYNKDDKIYLEKITKIPIDDNNFLLWIISFYSHS